jgi:anti-sigma factor RsiW
MTGMDCNQFVELVTAYLEGQLDPGTERRFVDHLAECDGCDRYLAQIRVTMDALGELPPASLSDSLSGDARERLLTAFREWDG